MFSWFKQLDELLRGNATQISSLEDGRIRLEIHNLIKAMLILGFFYGLCVGAFNLLHPMDEDAAVTAADQWMQMFASAVKYPLLFILTLLVTLPSLYVFNALVGSRLSMVSVLKLLIASIAIILTVAASLGPIVIFFSLCTTSYHFMMLLNVAVCTVAGVLGLTFLLRTLHRLVLVQEEPPATFDDSVQGTEPQPEASVENSSEDPYGLNASSQESQRLGYYCALDRMGPTHRKARSVFRIWTFVFALVGAQMSWVLRPFIGHPDLPFEWFRAGRESNFFLAVFEAFGRLLGVN